MNPVSLIKIVNMEMPYGRYRGRKLIDLPESYVLWLIDKAPPSGQLGDLIQELSDIKVNGLEQMVKKAVYSM